MENRTCAVEDCGRPARKRGWCSGHYQRWLATGDVRADVPLKVLTRHAPGLRCAVEDCEKPRTTRDWCTMHYSRWHQHGDPLITLIIVGDDQARIESYIDRSGGPDACHPWTGGQWTDGYGCVKVGDRARCAHVAIWELENGPKPPDAQLDHECHNRAVRDGSCRPGKCPHRLCCNLRHIIARASKDEHFNATTPWDRSAWARNRAKLTEAQVREIRRLLADGKPVSRRTDLAERYGVSTMQIYRIAIGRSWSWIPTENGQRTILGNTTRR
jgi:hypothetical protein